MIRADVTPIKAVKPKIEKVTSLKMLYITIFKQAGVPYGGKGGDHEESVENHYLRILNFIFILQSLLGTTKKWVRHPFFPKNISLILVDI